MASTFKAALLSGWHVHAQGYAQEFNQVEGCRIGAVYDEDRARGQALAQKFDCPYFEDFRAALTAPGISAGILNSATNLHKEHLLSMISLGKHIFTEKVLTASHREALDIKEALQNSGLVFAISFPHLGWAEIIKAKEIMDSGRLGQVKYARVRNVHNGAVAGWLPAHFYSKEQCGGGAMIDLGAHPMYTLAHFLGQPLSVQSLFTHVTAKEVEDNAACLLSFAGGAIGVSETGFLSSGNPYTLELSGSKGSLLLREGLFITDEQTGFKQQAVLELPSAQPSPLVLWALACLGQGQVPEHLGIGAAVRLSAIMDAAYRASASGSMETL